MMTKPMRADARRNYERLVGVARTTFAENGADAPLEDIARRAHLGIGTLYRHFPERDALMAAVFQSELEALVTLADELADADSPVGALADWLRAVIAHTMTYRGLGQALMATRATSMTACTKLLRAAGDTLLKRAQQAGEVRADANTPDLLKLSHAIGLAAEKSPGDPELADRLLALIIDGLRTR